jgi:general secretion pathway protein I
MRRRPDGGFTLLEVMVALAILAGALVLIGTGVAQNVRQANHARQVRIAALLMRQRMAQVEADLFKDGFSDFAAEDTGTFADAGFPQFRWVMKADKVELPANLAQSATDASRKLSDATSALAGSNTANTKALAQATDSSMMSTLLSSFGGVIEQVRLAMEDSVRRVTTTIYWVEAPREEKLEVTAYYVDTVRMTTGTGGAVSIPGQGGAGGVGGAGGGRGYNAGGGGGGGRGYNSGGGGTK